MSEPTIQEYLVNHLPSIIGRILAGDPIPGMEGTLFTLQITIAGEARLTFGISIRDAREITVTPGAILNPMVALTLPEDVFTPLTKIISSFTGRNQYDILKDKKGTVDIEIDMPGDWKLPVKAVINGSAEPYFKLIGNLNDLSEMATGRADATQSFMQGKIRINGDIGFAMQLAALNRK